MPFDQRILVSGTKRLKSMPHQIGCLLCSFDMGTSNRIGELGAQRFSYGPVASREYNVWWYGISSPYGKSQDD
ncbi:unnamed protein product [Fusarium graminearum]|uniref:Uncharacterized protein n=1 Tax=Gibberella zeae TaxID=5518 RepID=A0A4E9EGD5_GIBZA|nr:unnamed protein product [Fusarium graminearum]CAF3604587.1 unnamed protein product [Fusarium graminearum]CAG1986677.1 unnamed protein product [Fusarium graminearum]CAG2002667.1 unnamed protein product [Fusarium graminearum]CAG2003353.1 unnamed protein product [Fusarium graminearum]